MQFLLVMLCCYVMLLCYVVLLCCYVMLFCYVVMLCCYVMLLCYVVMLLCYVVMLLPYLLADCTISFTKSSKLYFGNHFNSFLALLESPIKHSISISR